jgi:hypothetical protein
MLLMPEMLDGFRLMMRGALKVTRSFTDGLGIRGNSSGLELSAENRIRESWRSIC